MITIYTKPSCVQCRATIREMDKLNLEYKKVDLSCNDEARDYVMALGYLQAPVVDTGTEMWSGYRPDRIKNLASV